MECALSEELELFIRSQLDDIYDIEYVKLCPSEWGEAMKRIRGWMRGVRRDNFQMDPAGSLSAMRAALLKDRFMSASELFFMDGTSSMQNVIKQRAADRHIVPRLGQQLCYEEIQCHAFLCRL